MQCMTLKERSTIGAYTVWCRGSQCMTIKKGLLLVQLIEEGCNCSPTPIPPSSLPKMVH